MFQSAHVTFLVYVDTYYERLYTQQKPGTVALRLD